MGITDVKCIKEVNLAETDKVVSVSPYFEITREDGTVEQAPARTDNRHYWEVKEWYENQETKPFEWQFEDLADPHFEETIYLAKEGEEEPETE